MKLKQKWALDAVVDELRKRPNEPYQAMRDLWVNGFDTFRDQLKTKSFWIPGTSYRAVKWRDIKDLGEKLIENSKESSAKD